MNRELQQQIANVVGAFDVVDLATSVAALQLIPANLTQTIRFEVLVHVTVSQRPSPGPQPIASGNDLELLCDDPPVAASDIVRYEDPPESHFVEPFLWRNGAYLVFPGIADDSSFMLRHLARALDVLPEFFPNHEFLSKSAATIVAILRISDALARGAGLQRWTEAGVLPERKVFVPPPDRLQHLKGVVSFTRDRLEELLQPCGGLDAIRELVTDFGTAVVSHEARGGSLITRPIVHHEDRYIVALPGVLLEAARSCVISKAVEEGVATELSRRYLKAGWATAKEALLRLDHRLMFEAPENLGGLPRSKEALFQFDTDKVAPIMLVSDSFEDHQPGRAFGPWHLQQYQQAIDDRFAATEGRLLGTDPPPGGILALLVVHGAGYEYLIGEPQLCSGPSLAMRAAELEWISFLDGGQALSLWKYALARRRARRRMQIMATSQLDEFELYRKHRRTYYISDDAPPHLLSVEVGMGLSLRTEVARKYDPHPAVTETGRITRVASLRGAGVPIYADMNRLGRQPSLLVEGLGTNVWILGPVQNENGVRFDYGMLAQIVDGLAYWVWQFTPALAALLDAARFDSKALPIYVKAEEDLAGELQQGRDGPAFVVTTEPNLQAVTVLVTRVAVPMLLAPDNRGERELMRSFLVGFRGFLPEDSPLLTDVELESTIDRFAPLGQKKHFFFLSVETSPDLDSSGLPRYRGLDEGDVEGVLDDLGEHLRDGLNIPLGPISPADRVKVFNQSVAYFYQTLQHDVSALAGRQWLEYLIARHEAAINESALRALTVPTRIACFSSVPEMVATLREEVPKLARASIARRFLIEYVATVSPNGKQIPSTATHDRLLAIAHHIVNFGLSSDSVRLGLTDPRLSMLGSGRLGQENDDYEQALGQFLAAFSKDVIGRSRRDFESHWRQGRAAPRDLTELDAASRAEFGVPLRQVIDLMMATVNIARLGDGVVVARLPLNELEKRLTAELRWPADQVSDALKQLTLIRRDDFLSPSAPFVKRDVYPWKFNRALSYLRRPFVTSGENNSMVVLWGPRQVYISAINLLALCYSARLLARTPEMRSLMSVFNDRRGKEFNDQVASVLREDWEQIVRVRATTFGKLRLPKEFGDLDVLTVNLTRRVVRVIECKDLALVRTPDELSNQLASLLPQSERDNGAATTRHKRRVEWVKDNIGEILSHLGVQADGEWEIEGIFVVDEPLFVPHLRTVEMRVVALEELRDASR